MAIISRISVNAYSSVSCCGERKTIELPIIKSDMSDPSNLHVCGVQLYVIKRSFIVLGGSPGGSLSP